MTDHRNLTLLDEIPAVLVRAGRALTPREILAQCDGLADGLASLMTPLQALCRDGTLIAEYNDAVANGGPRRYRLAGTRIANSPATAPKPSAEPQTAAAPATGRSAPRSTYRGIATGGERVRDLLSDDILSRSQIAERLGIDPDRVSDLLWKLSRSGQVEKLAHGLWRAVTGAAGENAPLPAAPRAMAEPRKINPAPVAAEPADRPLMAWRSDGVIELRRPAETIEITAAELAALTQFAARFAATGATHD